MRIAALSIAIWLAVPGASAQEAVIDTITAPKIQYKRIQFLSTSPAVWVRDTPPDQGRYLRLVVYSPIEEAPPELRIESWTYGDEGCCLRLVRSRQFTLAEPLAKTFGPLKATTCEKGFEFLGWVSLTSFRFSYLCRSFLARDAHKSALRVSVAE